MSSSSDVTDAVAMEEDLGRVEKLEKLLRALQDIKRENVRLRDNFSELQGVHRELRESFSITFTNSLSKNKKNYRI